MVMVMIVVISSDDGDDGDGDVWISQIWSEVFPRSLNWSRRPAAASPPFPIFINFSFLPWSADHLIAWSFYQMVSDKLINWLFFSKEFVSFLPQLLYSKNAHLSKMTEIILEFKIILETPLACFFINQKDQI